MKSVVGNAKKVKRACTSKRHDLVSDTTVSSGANRGADRYCKAINKEQRSCDT